MCTTGNSGVARKNELVIASSFRCALVLILVSWGLVAFETASFCADNNRAKQSNSKRATENDSGRPISPGRPA